MNKQQADKIERMLKWLIWKFTDGDNLRKLEDAPGSLQSKKGKALYLKLLNNEPDIHDIYKEIAGGEK